MLPILVHKLYVFKIHEVIFLDYMGVKLRITIESCSIIENEPWRYYIEVERKKNTEK